MIMQTPEQLLEELCKNADPRKVRSLRLIYAICCEQKDRGSNDYSVATIGRLSAPRKGPAAAAIRNPTGQVYRALIQAYAESVGGKKKRFESREIDPVDNVLEGINDSVVRTRVRLLLAELQTMRGQLNAARQLAHQSAVIEIRGSVKPCGSEIPPVSEYSLTEAELRTLRKAVAKETLDHWGWVTDESGRVVTDSGQTIFGPGFISALDKVLRQSEKRQEAISLPS